VEIFIQNWMFVAQLIVNTVEWTYFLFEQHSKWDFFVEGLLEFSAIVVYYIFLQNQLKILLLQSFYLFKYFWIFLTIQLDDLLLFL